MNRLNRQKRARNIPLVFLSLMGLHTMLTTDKPLVSVFAGIGFGLVMWGMWKANKQ